MSHNDHAWDCEHCEAIAEARAEDARGPLDEGRIRERENRYEAKFWGQS
jgi:hypothetical protein